ncbi:MAG: CBS domain-containing protein [Actinomycetota bacterium]
MKMKMLVADVMSVRLLAVRPGTPVKEAARMLVRSRIGGMPVVGDEGRLMGILSESDLQPVEEEGTRRPRATAADVMTSPVITLSEVDTVAEAARVLRRHRIKRAPVLRDGRLVGIVTQSDLLRPYLRTDGEIRADVEEALWEDGHASGADFDISVHAGVVRLEGTTLDRRQATLLAKLAAGVDGVVDVQGSMKVGAAARA